VLLLAFGLCADPSLISKALSLLPCTAAQLDAVPSQHVSYTCASHPFTSLTLALASRQPYPAPCTDPAHDPFFGIPLDALSAQPNIGADEWNVWLEWISRMGRWVNGEADAAVWGDWARGHIAKSVYQQESGLGRSELIA
jgi:hypothetical protein